MGKDKSFPRTHRALTLKKFSQPVSKVSAEQEKLSLRLSESASRFSEHMLSAAWWCLNTFIVNDRKDVKPCNLAKLILETLKTKNFGLLNLDINFRGKKIWTKIGLIADKIKRHFGLSVFVWKYVKLKGLELLRIIFYLKDRYCDDYLFRYSVISRGKIKEGNCFILV